MFQPSAYEHPQALGFGFGNEVYPTWQGAELSTQVELLRQQYQIDRLRAKQYRRSERRQYTYDRTYVNYPEMRDVHSKYWTSHLKYLRRRYDDRRADLTEVGRQPRSKATARKRPAPTPRQVANALEAPVPEGLFRGPLPDSRGVGLMDAIPLGFKQPFPAGHRDIMSPGTSDSPESPTTEDTPHTPPSSETTEVIQDMSDV
jgi:hypothetical protein